MEHSAAVAPFASSLLTVDRENADRVATGQYDPERQYTIWNDPFADPLMGAPLCTYNIGECHAWCRVPGSTNCSFGPCDLIDFYRCDYG